MRSAPNLLFVNGGIFERDRSGRVNALKIDLKTGRLIGARRAGTAAQLARVLAPNLRRFSGKTLAALSTFVRANLGAVNPSPGGGSPAGGRGTTASAPDNRRVPIDRDGGKHGQGSSVDTSPRSSGRRAAADSSSAATGNVCSDLNAVLCNNSQRQNAERLADDKKGQAVREFQSLARLDGPNFATILNGVLNDPLKFREAYSSFTSFLSGKIGSDARAALNTARSSLLASIDAQPLSNEAKEAVRKRLSAVKFRFTPNFKSLESIRGFVENCGPEAMGDGAFAIPALGEVVICPGLVFGAAGKGGEMVSHLIHVVAHEMGHHVGADRVPGSPTGFGEFKPLYRPMEQCYRKEYKISDDKLGEITADTWGIEALAVELRGKSRPEVIETLRNALAPLCGTPPSGEHPPGSFRVGITLGTNPRIRELLACDAPTSSRPACTFKGTEPDSL